MIEVGQFLSSPDFRISQERPPEHVVGRNPRIGKRAHAHCTDDDENNNEMEGIEVIDLCSVSRCGNDTISEGKESAMQESQDKSKHDETNKKAAELEDRKG